MKDYFKELHEKSEEEKRKKDLKNLRPVFEENLLQMKSYDLIQIIESDKKHDSNQACKGLIGFIDTVDNYNFLNVYKRDFDKFNISLTSKVEPGLYIIHPIDSSIYIDSENYFSYIKQEKVRELVRIAYELGAKEVAVKLMDKESKKSQSQLNVQGKAGNHGNIDVNVEEDAKKSMEFGAVTIERWDGNDHPERPTLKFFKNEGQILDMIDRRMNNTNALKDYHYQIKYNNSFSLKKSEAVKIDAVIQKNKFGIKENFSLKTEIANCGVLDYTIRF